MASMRTSGSAICKKKSSNKWHWTHDEDDLLTAIVRIYGPAKWDHIATFVPGRSGKSCRIRWLNQLQPKLNKTPFSVEEKQRLLLLHREFGNKWSIIVSHFPGRTDNQVKNQYHILAGTRYKKGADSSSSNDSSNYPRGRLENGSRGLSQYLEVPAGSQISDVTSQGTNYHGSGPLFGARTGRVAKGPSSVGGSSSVYGKNSGNSTQVGVSSSMLTSLGSHPHERKSYGDSMISDANSAGIHGHKFIDFLGVETLE